MPLNPPPTQALVLNERNKFTKIWIQWLESIGLEMRNGSDIVSAIDSELGSNEWQGAAQVIRVPITAPTNLNATGTLEYGTATINTITGSAINAEDIDLPIGVYKVTLQLSMFSATARTNVGFIFKKDGADYSTHDGMNYIRAANGHIESSQCSVDIVQYTSAGSFSVGTFEDAETGTVSINNSAYLLIEKIG